MQKCHWAPVLFVLKFSSSQAASRVSSAEWSEGNYKFVHNCNDTGTSAALWANNPPSPCHCPPPLSRARLHYFHFNCQKRTFHPFLCPAPAGCAVTAIIKMSSLFWYVATLRHLTLTVNPLAACCGYICPWHETILSLAYYLLFLVSRFPLISIVYQLSS